MLLHNRLQNVQEQRIKETIVELYRINVAACNYDAAVNAAEHAIALKLGFKVFSSVDE